MHTLSCANTKPFLKNWRHQSDGISHSVFSSGEGPGVLLLHELPGMTPEFWRLANWLAEHFTVWAPDLFGNSSKPTKPPSSPPLLRICISREIYLFSNNDPGPITQWLRSLSKELSNQQEERGIGVIGMCMTGNFALTLALDPWVHAPVTSQPGLAASLPLRNRDHSLQMNADEKHQLAQLDIDVLGLRFDGDKLCKASRFDTIRSVISEQRFKEHVIDDAHRNPNGPLKHPHAVLTADMVDSDDSVTKNKLMEVISFLKERIDVT